MTVPVKDTYPKKETTQVVIECDKHGTQTVNKTVTTYYGEPPLDWTERCPGCEQDMTDRRARQDAEYKLRLRQERIASNRQKSGLPLRCAGSKFESYFATTEKQTAAVALIQGYATNFSDIRKTGSNLALCGSVGNGKTHLAAAVANHVLDAGYKVIYTTVLQMVRSVRETWRDHSKSETEVIDRYLNADLLVLDEVGVQYGKEAEQNQVFEIVDGRYSNMRPTLIVSNLGKNGLQEALGERAFDRLFDRSSSVVVFDWESWRTTMPETSKSLAEVSQ